MRTWMAQAAEYDRREAISSAAAKRTAELIRKVWSGALAPHVACAMLADELTALERDGIDDDNVAYIDAAFERICDSLD